MALSHEQQTQLQSHLQQAVVACNDRCLYFSAKWYASTERPLGRDTDIHSGRPNSSTPLQTPMPRSTTVRPTQISTTMMPTFLQLHTLPTMTGKRPGWKLESCPDSSWPNPSSTAGSMIDVLQCSCRLQRLTAEQAMTYYLPQNSILRPKASEGRYRRNPARSKRDLYQRT